MFYNLTGEAVPHLPPLTARPCILYIYFLYYWIGKTDLYILYIYFLYYIDFIYIYILYIRANDSSAPTKSAQCQGRAKLLMKLFKKQANFALPW